MPTTTNQSGELVTFLVLLAVLLIVVIVVAAIVLYRRKQQGLTIKNSTFGNDVNGNISEATPPANRPTDEADEMRVRSGSGTTGNSGTGRNRPGS